MSIIQALKIILTLHCRQSSQLLSDSLDRRLSRVERLAMSLHLMVCHNCRRSRKRLKFLAEALRRLALGLIPPDPSAATSLSPEARKHIEEALRKQ